jgi:hypothetical protein
MPSGVLEERSCASALWRSISPRSIGYFGAIALATALEIIDPPVGLFIAAVPLFKLLEKREKALPARFLGEVLEGAAKPVGGDADAVIRLAPQEAPPEQR